MKKNSIIRVSAPPASALQYRYGDAKVETRTSNHHHRQSAASSSSSSSAAIITREKLLERMPTEEDINASAEAFIHKFRQQLLLQRMESIENYQNMVAK